MIQTKKLDMTLMQSNTVIELMRFMNSPKTNKWKQELMYLNIYYNKCLNWGKGTKKDKKGEIK